MDAQNFVYWLQGYFELNESNKLSENQVMIIKDHLAQVLTKTTPDRPNSGHNPKRICASSSKEEMVFC